MRIDEGRRRQPTSGVDLLTGLGGDLGFHRRDLAFIDGDVDALAAIGEIGVANDQVEHGASLT